MKKKVRAPFEIGNTSVAAGQRLTVDLPIARLHTHTTINMPVQVLHGKQDGPTLFVSAAIHGDEILGVEIIRRLLKQKSLRFLRGTLLAVPIVNVFGFLNHARYSPDRRDLNRFFPGNENGSLTSQMANLFMKQIVARCTHGIDLHTGSNHRTNLPQLRAYLDDPETERLARAFGVPVILDANLLEGSLRQAVHDKDLPILLYEAGEVLRFDEAAIRVGLHGILSVMRAIGMLSKRRPRTMINPLIARSSTWVRTPISGIVSTDLRLGEVVSEQMVLGTVADPFGESETEILSTTSGVVIGKLNLPLVNRGDALFHIARMEEEGKASSTIQTFRQEFEPDW